ncbi:molybdopterin-dependent oxidoreductase [Stackebrandtia soli]|uniref:molybdopterin-dependent oxidoreductase n=1 Tax=Stackebrandtia soli TaxID=1892856 RepID=UPI0039E80E05
MRDDEPNRPPRWAAALWGAVSAGAALAMGELTAAFTIPQAAPLIAVGDAAIAISPEPLKRWTIDVFGTADKLALLIGIVVVLGCLAALAGIANDRDRRIGPAAAIALAAIGVAAAVTRPSASAFAAFPSVVAAVIAAALLWAWPRPAAASDDPRGFDRRRFLWRSLTLLGGAAISGAFARSLGTGAAVDEARSQIRLPEPTDPAPDLPGVSDFGVKDLAPWRTPNDDFYRIDTALSVPRLDPETYRLRIFGRVDRELTFSYRDLLKRPLVERDITLCCVSNEVGGGLVGNARWLGVPLADLLEEARVQDGADQLVGRSSDGWTAGTPVELCVDGRDAMLAVGMNGEPLPVDHGFPVRMVVPGLYGYVSATKWLTELELTSFADFDAYWIRRNWALPSPIKTASRIDTPRGSATPGVVAVAGVAWAQHRGIGAVEVRVDDGPWHEAKLSDVSSTDTWRQWLWEWDATPGDHTLTVRATDADGDTQTAKEAPVAPDGATGWHTVNVTVA